MCSPATVSVLRVTSTPRGERLLRVGLDEVSHWLLAALIASEDRRFFEHDGVDMRAVARAGWSSLRNGRVVSGASTLSMQVARLVEPRKRNIWGKLKEMLRARQLEREFAKHEILEQYINLAPLGGPLRGFEAAARYWFGKSARALEPQEAAMLVAMLPAPSRRSPSKRPRELLLCRNDVLEDMHDAGDLSAEQFREYKAKPLGARPHAWPFAAPHACDWLLATRRGPRIQSSIELPLQRRVEELVRQRDPSGGDSVAVVVLDRLSPNAPGLGVRAMCGAPDWRAQKINAALCPRSAGSTLKPFVYALALERGVVSAKGEIVDAPLALAGARERGERSSADGRRGARASSSRDGRDRAVREPAADERRVHARGRTTKRDAGAASQGTWRPRNFDEGFAGTMRLGDALRASRNLPAIRLLEAVGTERFESMLRALGLPPTRAAPGLDAALGTSSYSPLALALAYRTFADSRARLPASFDSRGQVLDMLAAVSPDSAQFPDGRVAFKTGTSSGRRDAWSIGVGRENVVCVWLGNLDGRAASDLVGGRAATQLMAAVMAAAEAR